MTDNEKKHTNSFFSKIELYIKNQYIGISNFFDKQTIWFPILRWSYFIIFILIWLQISATSLNTINILIKTFVAFFYLLFTLTFIIWFFLSIHKFKHYDTARFQEYKDWIFKALVVKWLSEEKAEEKATVAVSQKIKEENRTEEAKMKNSKNPVLMMFLKFVSRIVSSSFYWFTISVAIVLFFLSCTLPLLFLISILSIIAVIQWNVIFFIELAVFLSLFPLQSMKVFVLIEHRTIVIFSKAVEFSKNKLWIEEKEEEIEVESWFDPIKDYKEKLIRIQEEFKSFIQDKNTNDNARIRNATKKFNEFMQKNCLFYYPWNKKDKTSKELKESVAWGAVAWADWKNAIQIDWDRHFKIPLVWYRPKTWLVAEHLTLDTFLSINKSWDEILIPYDKENWWSVKMTYDSKSTVWYLEVMFEGKEEVIETVPKFLPFKFSEEQEMIEKKWMPNLNIQNLIFSLWQDSKWWTVKFDMVTTPHVLIAWWTWSWKSVAIMMLISSIINAFSPEEAEILLIDPLMEYAMFDWIKMLKRLYIRERSKEEDALRCYTGIWEAYAKISRKQEKFQDAWFTNLKDFNANWWKEKYTFVIIDEFEYLQWLLPKEKVNWIYMRYEVANTFIAWILSSWRKSWAYMILWTQSMNSTILETNNQNNITIKVCMSVSWWTWAVRQIIWQWQEPIVDPTKFSAWIDEVTWAPLAWRWEALIRIWWLQKHLRTFFVDTKEIKAVVSRQKKMYWEDNTDYMNQKVNIDEKEESVKDSTNNTQTKSELEDFHSLSVSDIENYSAEDLERMIERDKETKDESTNEEDSKIDIPTLSSMCIEWTNKWNVINWNLEKIANLLENRTRTTWKISKSILLEESSEFWLELSSWDAQMLLVELDNLWITTKTTGNSPRTFLISDKETIIEVIKKNLDL